MTDPNARINTRWGHDRAGAVSEQAGQGQESTEIGTDVPHRPECSIRRATPSIGRDEYGDPYIHWDDDPEGEWVSYHGHVEEIRACEQRVRLHAQLDREADWREGRAAGLDAAREAVAAAYDDDRYGHKDDWGVPVVYKDLMLAAIDALREGAK